MKKPGLILLNLVIYSAIAAAQSMELPKYQSLEPYDFHMAYLKADSALLIDVREKFEFRGRRLREAINIASSDNLEYAADTISKNYSLFFYCTTDWRSERVAEYFSERGFRNVYSLEGGIVAWKKDGFPVTRKRK
jgi:rhodanese-related sulfurtransferase